MGIESHPFITTDYSSSCIMMSSVISVLVVVIGLSQGNIVPPPPAPVPHPQPPPGYRPVPYGPPSPFGGFGGGIDPTTLLLLGGGLGGSSGSTDSLLPLLLLGGGGLGGKGGYGGGHHGGALGGLNPLMLSLLSCKEPVADCQKPNEGNTLCGKGAAKVCCKCTGGGLFGLN